MIIIQKLVEFYGNTVEMNGSSWSTPQKNVEIMVPLRYLSNFCRTIETPLINCEINLELNLSENCVIVATNVAAQAASFLITEIKFYVQIVTLSTQDNAKLLEYLKSGFKRTIAWNKYQPKL